MLCKSCGEINCKITTIYFLFHWSSYLIATFISSLSLSFVILCCNRAMWNVHIIMKPFLFLFISCVYNFNCSCYVEELYYCWFFTLLLVFLFFKFWIETLCFFFASRLCYVYFCKTNFFIHSLRILWLNPCNPKARFDKKKLVVPSPTPCLHGCDLVESIVISSYHGTIFLLLNAILNGLKHDTSKGCKTCEICDVK